MAKSNHSFSPSGNTGMSDAEFKDLYKKSYLKAVHYSNQYVRNYELAKEIAQDSFINLWEKRETLSPDKGSIEYYLITIVRNNSYNVIRSKMRETYRIGQAISIDDRINSIALSQDPVDELTYNEMAKIINSTIGNMSHKIREVYLMSREQEMTYPQIAQKLNVSVKTIEYRISKALALFRSSLSKHMPLFIGVLIGIALAIIDISTTYLSRTISIFTIIVVLLNLIIAFNLGGISILV